MSYKWTELAPAHQPRNPEADFILNALKRFTIADLGLSDEDDPQARRAAKYGEQWWVAVVTVAKKPDKVTSLSIVDLLNKAANYSPAALSSSLFIPREYDGTQRKRTDLDVITIYAQKPYLDAVNAQDGEAKLGISSVIISAPLEIGTLNPGAEPFQPGPVTFDASSQTVVTAVIDHGIAIAHDLFRRRNGNGPLELSRVDLFWDMDGTPAANAQVQASVGRVWTRAEIEGVLQQNFHSGLLDEAAVYRTLGLIDWRVSRRSTCAQRVSHGTHVLGLAAGYDADQAVGADRRIIAVQLPTRLVENTSGDGLELKLELALRFVADNIGRYRIGGVSYAPPVVMNFSFGNFRGPHDGTGEIERMVDDVLGEMSAQSDHPRLLFLPSGNGNLSRCHAVCQLTDLAPAERMDWVLQPDDRSASFASVWLPMNPQVQNGAVTLRLTGPGAVGSISVIAGMTPGHAVLTDDAFPAPDNIIAELVYEPPVAPTNRGKFTVMAAPTHHPENVRPLTPSGAWTLEVAKTAGAPDMVLNIWVQRDETLPGFPAFGRQSYLSEDEYHRFRHPGGAVKAEDTPPHNSPVCRAGMINGVACGDLPAVIAGYVRSDDDMADYSAGGPTQNAVRLAGPDASAVSDDSPVLSGVLSAGSSSGSLVAMNGTSVSTPTVARWAAGRMAQAPTAPFGRLQVVVQALTDDPMTPDKPSIFRTGGGRMDLDSVFGQLRWQKQTP